jgi:hypothetical protein
MTLDTITLTTIINRCFEYSLDGQLSESKRAKFLVQGKRLRGHLMNLLSAQFEEGTQAVLDANAKLKEVNKELKDSAAVIENAVNTLSNIAQLVGSLDRLLSIAVAFV